MKVYFNNPELEKQLNSVRNIFNLYYEEVVMVMGSGETEIRYDVNEDEVTGYLKIDGETYEQHVTISSQVTRNRALLVALLKMLTRHTGVTQQWGILTGIRPTKLYHRLYKQGKSHEAISEELRSVYLIDQGKIDLMRDIVHVQNKALPDLYELQREVSIYIGIPFCPTKCAYCTFPAYSILVHKNDVPEFLVGLLHEIKETGKFLKEQNIKITSIYFGGGTPTSITPKDLAMLLDACYDAFDMTHVREVTVEAGRPDTIDEATLRVLNDYNIDRISINPQSFTDETMKAIGRHHTVQETIDKYKLAKQFGMNNINMDLIIGLPNETSANVENSLEHIKKLAPESLTVHTLSFKRASEMTKNKSKYPVASREEIMKMMDLSRSFAQAENYTPYYLYRQKNILGNLENIGYAKQDYSLYNILIMEEVQTIIGIGCGASSKLIHPVTGKIENYLNPKDPKSYNSSYEHYTSEKIRKMTALYAADEAVNQ